MKKLTHFFNTAYLYGEKKMPYFSFFVNFFNKLINVFLYLQLKRIHFFTLTNGGYAIFGVCAFLTYFSIVRGLDLIFPVKLCSYAIGIGAPICSVNLYFLFKIKGAIQYLESLFGKKYISEFFSDRVDTEIFKTGLTVMLVLFTVKYTLDPAIFEYFKASNVQPNEAVVNNEITADMGDFLLNDIKENMSKTQESVRREIVTEISRRLKH